MSIGYPDFNTRSLIEEYNVVNTIGGGFTLTNLYTLNTFTRSGIKGLLSGVLIHIIPSDVGAYIRFTLTIDTKIIDVLSIIRNKFNAIIESSESFLIVTKHDYLTLKICVELKKPIMFFDSFSITSKLNPSYYDTDVLLYANYMTASPTMLYEVWFIVYIPICYMG